MQFREFLLKLKIKRCFTHSINFLPIPCQKQLIEKHKYYTRIVLQNAERGQFSCFVNQSSSPLISKQMDYSCILYESLAKIKTKSNIPIPSFGRKKKLKELMCLVSKLTFILSLVVLTEGCQYYIWAAPGLVSVCLRRVTH